LETTESTVAGAKVLVIDDSNTIRRSAEIFLRQGGHEGPRERRCFEQATCARRHSVEHGIEPT
jgi:hypothetical protein